MSEHLLLRQAVIQRWCSVVITENRFCQTGFYKAVFYNATKMYFLIKIIAIHYIEVTVVWQKHCNSQLVPHLLRLVCELCKWLSICLQLTRVHCSLTVDCSWTVYLHVCSNSVISYLFAVNLYQYLWKAVAHHKK